MQIQIQKFFIFTVFIILYIGQQNVYGQNTLSATDTCTDCVPGQPYVSGSTGCFPPCKLCYNTLELKGATATGQTSGVYFFLSKSELDAVMGNHGGDGIWEGKTHVIFHVNTEVIGTVELYVLESDDQYAYGTFTDDNPMGRPDNYFNVGDKIQFLHDQKCATCVSTHEHRELAPNCQCKTGFAELNDAAYTCIVQCGHQCQTCEIGNLIDCLTCKDANFLPPSCLYPKVGYLVKNDEGTITYPKCAKKCTACKDEIDNCVPTSEVLTTGGLTNNQCAGLNRDDANQCNCVTGFYDNQGQNKDCTECPEFCESCISQSYCTSCVESLNRELNLFSGQCECKRGYQTTFDNLDVCKKCFMVSDQCVELCPPNTTPNEELMVCETMEYQMVSHMILIYVLGGLILIIEIALCAVMKNKLFKHITIMKKERTIRKIIQAKQQKMDEDYEKQKQTSMFNTQSPIKNRKSRKQTKGFKFSVDKSNLDSTANINDTTPGGMSSNNLIESTNHMVSPLQDVEEDSPHKNKMVKRQRSRFLSKKMSVTAAKPVFKRGTGSVDVSNNPGLFGQGSIDNTPQMSDNRMLGGQSVLQSKRGDISNFEIKEQKEEDLNDSLFGAKKQDNQIGDFDDFGGDKTPVNGNAKLLENQPQNNDLNGEAAKDLYGGAVKEIDAKPKDLDGDVKDLDGGVKDLDKPDEEVKNLEGGDNDKPDEGVKDLDEKENPEVDDTQNGDENQEKQDAIDRAKSFKKKRNTKRMSKVVKSKKPE